MPVPDQVTWVSVFIICLPAHASLCTCGTRCVMGRSLPTSEALMEDHHRVYRSFNFPMIMVMILEVYRVVAVSHSSLSYLF